MIIAIDGPAASGKGTIGRRLAKELGLAFLDTGLLYRAAAKRILQKGISPFNSDAVTEAIKGLQIEEGDGENLRDPNISKFTPYIANIEQVREYLASIQRKFAHNPPFGTQGVVLDGRDIGTVICPDADIKLFVTAELYSRARRRYRELLAIGVKTSFQAVHRDLRRRDEQDASRLLSPLKPAEDAVILDTTEMSIDEAIEKALEIVRRCRSGTSKAC